MDKGDNQIQEGVSKNGMKEQLVFISHDTRDSKIAEAFSQLLTSVSAGVLKSFRSSDKKSKQGIEFGVDWYPELMRKLDIASDVVCLLTSNSINRPWILYEAGVAKGKLDTPVYGLALGVPLEKASSGPFSQFQNCDDDTDSLTSLIIQLLEKIPNADPNRDAVIAQVENFKKQLNSFKSEVPSKDKESSKELGNESMIKIFEEIKIMFSSIQNNQQPNNGKYLNVQDHGNHIETGSKATEVFHEVWSEFHDKNRNVTELVIDAAKIKGKGTTRESGLSGIVIYKRSDGSILAERAWWGGVADGCCRYFDSEGNIIAEEYITRGVQNQLRIFNPPPYRVLKEIKD